MIENSREHQSDTFNEIIFILQLTDSYEMSISSALDTMKTICMDVATDDEEKKINGETCPNDCNGNGECVEGVCKCNPGFTAFDCSTKDGK